MTDQKGSKNTGLGAVLEELGFSEQEINAAAEFFEGRAGEEVLAGFVFRDLSDMPSEAAWKLFQELARKRKHDRIKRLFLLLFAKGEATCQAQIPEEICRQSKEFEAADAVKYAAVHAVAMGIGAYHFNRHSVTRLLELTGNDPEVLKKALGYEKNPFVNGKLVLLALYFFAKYGAGEKTGDGKLPGIAGKSQDVPEGFFGVSDGSELPCGENGDGEQNEHSHGTATATMIAKEDAPLLALYEEYAVACLVTLHCRKNVKPPYSVKAYPQNEPELCKKLLNAISGDGFAAARQGIAGAGVGISWNLRSLVAGASYLNCGCSERLKNIVRLCVAADPEGTLDVMQAAAFGVPMMVSEAKKAYDKIFLVDGERYIRWAFGKKYWEVLKRQISENTEIYLYVMGKVGTEDANRMLALIREAEPELYKKILSEKCADGGEAEREKVIAGVVKDSVNAGLAAAYLRGECGADALYPQNWLDGDKHYYAGGYARDLVDSYLSNYEEPEFFRRCKVYMLVSHGGFFFRRDVTPAMNLKEKANAKGVREIFADFEAEGVPLIWQIFAVSLIYDTLLYEEGKKSFLAEAAGIFSGYLEDGKRREELGLAFAAADAIGRCFAVKVYALDVEKNKEEILAYSQDSAKIVRQELLDVLCAQREFEGAMKKMLLARRAAERELAARVLLCWQGQGADYRELFRQALAKEKNAKVKELLKEVLGADALSGGGAPEVSREELVKELHSGGKKRGLAWAYETPFSAVHMKNGEMAGEQYLQAVLLCYASEKEALASGREALTAGKAGYGLSRNAAFLAESLDDREFAVYVNELFDKWLAAGAEAKKRWVLYAAAIHGGSAIIEKLTRQIKRWSEHARSAIACEAVRALALSPLPQGLLGVDDMARKMKSRQVRAAAGEALRFAAEQRGLTHEELADRIVPDFGFDERMERCFDYGARKFLVAVTPELELEVFEAAKEAEIGCGAQKSSGQGKQEEQKSGRPEQGKSGQEKQELENAAAQISEKIPEKFHRGKKLKTLPAPGKRDDEKKAAAAYEEFGQMKKQLKATMASQKQRLGQALATARTWEIEDWVQLFVKNPVMRPFATGLIWGVYEKDELVQSFRYMEDGSLNTEDEEEYALPVGGQCLQGAKNAADVEGSQNVKRSDDVKCLTGGAADAVLKIRLVHPLELSGKSKTAWKQQLKDYEVTQPIEQLGREVYVVEDEEAGQRELVRFDGQSVSGVVLNRRLLEFGWCQTPVDGGGLFFGYYREDPSAGLAAKLEFSGSYLSGGVEDTTIYGVRFYKIGADNPKINLQGAADEEKACQLREIPARYFSEVIWQLTKAIS